MAEKAKAMFFAQYLGQKSIWYNGRQDAGYEVSYITLKDVDNSDYLLLRSIEQLSDEEMVTVAKLAYGSSWEDSTCIASKAPNHDNVHGDIVSVEIETFINYPPLPKYYKCCHIQIDRVDADINMLRFTNDGKDAKDDVIGSLEQWAILDYLRSIGILLTFTYLNEDNKPTTLTPDQIIQLGWAKFDNK